MRGLAGSGDRVQPEQGDRCSPPDRFNRVLDGDEQTFNGRRIPDLTKSIGRSQADPCVRVLEGEGEKGEGWRTESDEGGDGPRANKPITVSEAPQEGRDRPDVPDLPQCNTGLPPDIWVFVGSEGEEVIERKGPDMHEGLCCAPADALLVRPLEGRSERRQCSWIPEFAEGGDSEVPHCRFTLRKQADEACRIAPPTKVRHPAFWDEMPGNQVIQAHACREVGAGEDKVSSRRPPHSPRGTPGGPQRRTGSAGTQTLSRCSS